MSPTTNLMTKTTAQKMKNNERGPQQQAARLSYPEAFLESMERLLGTSYPDYLLSQKAPKQQGLRVNTLKISPEAFEALGLFSLTPVPWVKGGYFYPESERPALSPYYHAGLYYLQEPSAMTPAALLPLEGAKRVLDLCAAPGGKSTALLSRMQGEGVLFSNDISNSRAQALIKNIELFGAVNSVNLNADPARLSARFPGYFDRILIDAPCSGEGMFRKDSSVVRSYLEHGKQFYVELQRKILPEAVKMLAPGGFLLYSTCTFSLEEDEEMVLFLKSLCPSLSVVPLSAFYEGFSEGRPDLASVCDKELSGCVRIYPHKMQGEGHFLALLKKNGEEAPSPEAQFSAQRGARISKEAEVFLQALPERLKNHLSLHGQKLYAEACTDERLSGLRILRNGLYLGEEKTKRFEPSQALAMALRKNEFTNRLDLDPEDPRVLRYLKGETVALSDSDSFREGTVLVTLSGFPLGFAKKSGNMLKNQYLPGWRFMGNR